MRFPRSGRLSFDRSSESVATLGRVSRVEQGRRRGAVPPSLAQMTRRFAAALSRHRRTPVDHPRRWGS